MLTRYARRKATNRLMLGLCAACIAVALVPLVLVLAYLIYQGATSISWTFLTQLPAPVGESGGMGNAILGTVTLIGLACLFGLPVGILAGLYLSESGDSRLGSAIRFTADVLNGVPSIVVGVFVYTLVVAPMKGYSALAGGLALGLIMVPIVTRTTEEIVRLVPSSLREAALALGVPSWKVVLRVVLVTARPGIITGVMLAIARIAGETAPLLFTALGNRYWQTGLTQPIASLPVQIYEYAQQPFDELIGQAWAGALVLIGLIFALNLAVRFLGRSRL